MLHPFLPHMTEVLGIVQEDPERGCEDRQDGMMLNHLQNLLEDSIVRCVTRGDDGRLQGRTDIYNETPSSKVPKHRLVKEKRHPHITLARKSERVDAMEMGSTSKQSRSLHIRPTCRTYVRSYSITSADAAATTIRCVISRASLRLL